MIYTNDIFLLMEITATIQLVYQITLVGQQNKSSGFLVQTANRIDTYRIVDIVNDIIRFLLLRSTYNPSGLIECNQDFRLIMGYILSLEGNNLSFENTVAKNRNMPIDQNFSGFYGLIRFSSGTHTSFT